jgi:hypothetical protein
MADKSYGQFGTFKWDILKYILKKSVSVFIFKFLSDPNQKKPLDSNNISDLSQSCQKDIKYFLQNSNKNESNQNLNYTWEKSSEESPSIFRRHEIDDNPDDDKYKNTLQLMETRKGHAHITEQNKWEADRCSPPELKPQHQKRRTAVLSTMTRFAEEMNVTFPGYKLY